MSLSVPVQTFDTAVVATLSKAVSDGQCPELVLALTKAMNEKKNPTHHPSKEASGTPPHSSHSLDKDRPSRSRKSRSPSHSRRRSKSRSRQRSYSRHHSSRKSRKRSRSKSRSPRRKHRKRHSRRRRSSSGSHEDRIRQQKYTVLDSPPETALKGAEYRFSVNKKQTKFNDKAIPAVHYIAKALPPKSKESLDLLEKLKGSIIDRQEDVWVADAYGLNVAGELDNSNDMPISKKKMKEVNRALKSHGSEYPSRGGYGFRLNAPQFRPPFCGQRGGQPRFSNNYGTQQWYGLVASGNNDSSCYLCHEQDHWARNCPSYSRGGFRNHRYQRYQRGASTGVPKPLFGPKSA